MVVVRIVLVLTAIAAAATIAAHATRDATGGRAGSPFGSPSDTSTTTATPSTDPSARDGSGRTDARQPTETATDLTPRLLRTVRDDLASWNFPSHRDARQLASIMENTLDADHRELLRDWFLRRALHGASDDADPIPEEVYRVELTNGRTLFARKTANSGDDLAVTTITGIQATFPSSSIRASVAIERAKYLRETSGDFRRKIDRLDASSASELEIGIRYALRRGETQEADRLYTLWLETDGPIRLARRTSRKNTGFHFAALIATTDTPLGGASDARHANVEGLNSTPTSLEDLSAKIDGVYRIFRQGKASKADLERIVGNLSRWETWLEQTVAAVESPPSNLTEIRRRLQHLRLDLLKSSGF